MTEREYLAMASIGALLISIQKSLRDVGNTEIVNLIDECLDEASKALPDLVANLRTADVLARAEG